MRKTRLFAVFVLLLVFGTGAGLAGNGNEGEDVLTLTLEQARQYALKHSTTTTNARLEVKRAKKKIWETTAEGLPQVNGGIDYQNFLKLPVTLIPAEFFDEDRKGEFEEVSFGTQHNVTADVTISQLVFNGSYIVALQASKVYLQISKNSLIKSEIETKEAVSKTYYLVLLAQDAREKQAATLENLKKTLFETKEMQKAGFLEDTDVDQLKLSVAGLENAVRSLDRQVRVTRRLLNFQMGLDLEKPIRLVDSLENILADVQPKQMLKLPFKLEDHIDFQIMNNKERSDKLLLKREKSDYLPSINAYLSFRKNAIRDKFDIFKKGKWFPTTVLGVKVTIPIFSSFKRSARVAQARLELEKTRNSKLEAARGLQLELSQARTGFADAGDTKVTTGANAQLAKRIYEKTQVKYKEGISSSLELVQTHNQYLTAESNYTRAVVDYLNAKLRLEKILSRL